MNQHRFALALCALVSSLLLVDVANAYPTTSTTTVKKTYRPLDLALNRLEADTSGCDGCGDVIFTEVNPNGEPDLSVTLVFTGTWTPNLESIGYPSTVNGGVAGYWVYELDTTEYTSLGVSQEVVGNTLVTTVSAGSGGVAFGTLTYVGGFVADTGLPPNDTPLPGDVFQLFTTPSLGAALLATTLLDDESVFTVELTEQLVHVGPYVLSECNSDYPCLVLDDDVEFGRNTIGCDAPSDTACGRMEVLNATSVPEPGTLALFGLGLAGLGIRLRSRRKALLV